MSAGAESRPRSPAGPQPDRHPPPLAVTTAVAHWKLPEPLAREVVVPTGSGRALVAGGLVHGDVTTRRTYELNLLTGSRRELPALPIPVHDAAGALLGGHALVVGGGNTTEQATVQRLSLATPRWRAAARLPQRRSDLVTATVGGSVFVLGGYDGTAMPAAVLESSNGRDYHVVGRLAVAVRYPAVAVADGQVWLFGGERDNVLLNVVQRFNPRSGRTRVVGRLPIPSGHGAAFAVGRKLLLAGGRVGPDTATSAIWEFDPSSARFHRAGSLPYPVADMGLASEAHLEYLLGGETPALTSKVIRIAWRSSYSH
jgi:Kelch motif